MRTAKFNTLMTEIANDFLGKCSWKTQPWITEEILGMFDTKRNLKTCKNTANGAVAYREINSIRKGMKKAKEEWIKKQCVEVEESLSRYNSKRAFQVVKDLTVQQQEGLSSGERSHKTEIVKSQQGPRKARKVPHGRNRYQEMERLLLRVVQPPDQQRPQCVCQSGIVER